MVLEFFLSVLATVLGGLVLAFVLFYGREKWFPLPEISGEWTFTTVTKNTSYNPYHEMRLTYKAVIFCEGLSITGTAEKIHEKTLEQEISYTGENRVRGDISGSIEKRYFSKDRIRIHIIEYGEKRKSTGYHNLVVEEPNLMVGKFFSTAADSKGNVNWNRDGMRD